MMNIEFLDDIDECNESGMHMEYEADKHQPEEELVTEVVSEFAVKNTKFIDQIKLPNPTSRFVMEPCFLCGQQNGRLTAFSSVQTTVVTSSKQPLKKVLQHLANFLKTKLIFKPSACICLICLRELCNYDDLMMRFLTYQRKLTRQLQDMINAEHSKISRDVSKHLKTNTEFKYVDNFKEIENQFLSAPLAPYEKLKTDNVENDETIDLDSNLDEILESSDDSLDDMEEVEECLVCGATFKTIEELADHSLREHGPKPKICDICGVSRRDEELMELHMNTHQGKAETDCPVCGKQFARTVNTIRHMRSHSNKKPFQCEICGECFTCSYSLIQHGFAHINDSRISCEVCQQTFKSRKTLRGHMAKHKADRPRFNCPQCSKSFAERYTLKVHMKTHNIKLEKAASQSILTDAEGEDAVNEIIIETYGIEKDIRCVICKREFEKNFDLNQHLRKEHDVIIE